MMFLYSRISAQLHNQIHPNHLTTALIWIIIWLIRSDHDDTRWQDLFLFVLSEVWLNRSIILSILSPFKKSIGTITTMAILVFLFMTAFALSRSFHQKSRKTWSDVDCTEPLILRCRTTHSRMFPKRHSFGYRYLQVAVPVGYCCNYSSIISVGPNSSLALFSVNAADYLIKSSTENTLEGKLTEYLESQVCLTNF
jgi:hypothetical protein